MKRTTGRSLEQEARNMSELHHATCPSKLRQLNPVDDPIFFTFSGMTGLPALSQ